MHSRAAIAHGFTTHTRTTRFGIAPGKKKVDRSGTHTSPILPVSSSPSHPSPFRHPSLNWAARTAVRNLSAAGTAALAGVMCRSVTSQVSVYCLYCPPQRIDSLPLRESVARVASQRTRSSVRHFFFITHLFFLTPCLKKTVANGGKALPAPRAGDGPVVGAPGPRPGGNAKAAPGAPGMAPVGRAQQPAAGVKPSAGCVVFFFFF